MIAKTKRITKLHDSKKASEATPYLDPEFIFLATTNARTTSYDLNINVGDHVDLYQVIGVRHASFFDQPIHSTVSGEFVGLEKHYHRNGKIVDFIKIKNDHKFTAIKGIKPRSEEEISKLTVDDLVNIAKEKAMVGLGGSSFPTYIKLKTDAKIETILINGIECEPLISADDTIMWEESDKIIKGMQILLNIYHAKRCILCVKKMKKTLISHYTDLFKNYPGLEIVGVGNYYPQGWEIEMIKTALGIKMKPGELPTKYGLLDFNVTSVVGLYLGVVEDLPVVSRFISIQGDGVKSARNFKVRVGTPLSELINECGGYADPELPKNIILGGPMMGASIVNDDCIITKTVTSVIILNDKKWKEEPCVRCGSCVLSCPTGLEPVQIMNAVKALDKERIKYLNPNKCIECGLCSYSCTSKIRVLDYVRRAKLLSKL